MKNWKHTIDFNSFWEDEDITVKQKGELAVTKLKPLLKHYPDDSELEEIIEQFECICDCDTFTALNDFDERMHSLYDWADDNNVWINTFG